MEFKEWCKKEKDQFQINLQIYWRQFKIISSFSASAAVFIRHNPFLYHTSSWHFLHSGAPESLLHPAGQVKLLEEGDAAPLAGGAGDQVLGEHSPGVKTAPDTDPACLSVTTQGAEHQPQRPSALTSSTVLDIGVSGLWDITLVNCISPWLVWNLYFIYIYNKLRITATVDTIQVSTKYSFAILKICRWIKTKDDYVESIDTKEIRNKSYDDHRKTRYVWQ